MEWLTAAFGILKTLSGFGDTVRDITKAITEKQIAAINAGTDERKAELSADVEALKLRRDVLVAEAPGSRVNMLVRVVLSIPAIILLWKLEVWDRVLDWGSTPKLSVEEWTYVWAVTGFYLLNRTIQAAKK